MAGRLTCSIHHVIAGLGGALALVYNSSEICRYALLWESGFELFDGFHGLIGSGLTDMHGLPLYMHHGIALTVQFTSLCNDLDWTLLAQLLCILLPAGAHDMFHHKVLKDTPVYDNSKLMWRMTFVQFIWFLASRVLWFSWVGYHLTEVAFAVDNFVGVIGLSTFLTFMGYHGLVATAILGALMNNGRLMSAFRHVGKKKGVTGLGLELLEKHSTEDIEGGSQTHNE
eukprot:CAMPEP_0175897572 /NCGR_PEP_ID=MMETSP0108-20121206/789_1 /TAXON_ID=195067 ORGANISM="Goniomonas pacifica, Strain CCMP1869" /NCGR_SAMPLE_ID=MMETSP0108 /ASSEMBLY_ACC=CAM_ASM_000204 /LENGTH=226 /DNA_ID=CAMNT_0017218875 /DNA_START=82 /DNA_END=762 /DNA_ORIENTATION=-